MCSSPPVGPRGGTTVGYGSHREAFGSLWLPEADHPLPLVVLLHGGFWRTRMSVEATEPLAAGIAQLGAVVWNVEYRRHDRGGGWRDTLADVAAAIDFVPKLAVGRGIDTRTTVVVGHSAGAQLALWTAMRARRGCRRTNGSPPTTPSAVVSLAGICDMVAAAKMRLGEDAVVEFLGGSAEERPEPYQLTSPRLALPLGIPQYLVHGDADQRVPFTMSRDYAAAATASGDPVELIRLAGTDHVGLLDPHAPAGRQVLDTIGEALRNGAARTGGRDVRAASRAKRTPHMCPA